MFFLIFICLYIHAFTLLFFGNFNSIAVINDLSFLTFIYKYIIFSKPVSFVIKLKWNNNLKILDCQNKHSFVVIEI